jgi:cytochrome c-type biogenesis protein CcmH
MASWAAGRQTTVRKWTPLAALLVIAVVALVIGTRPHHQPATIQSETYSIANQVKCPVCSGETAAESDTPASVNIRAFITQKLEAGQSRQQILNELVASYGSSELEKPPAKGANLLLWFLPGIAVVAAACGLVVVFRRWRLSRVSGVSDDDLRLVGGVRGRPETDDEEPR